MANPPFNVDKVDKKRIADEPRFGLGVPRVDNANCGLGSFILASESIDDSAMVIYESNILRPLKKLI